MESIQLLIVNDSIIQLAERAWYGIQFETTRYAIGTLGVFFAIWVLLAPWIQNRRIRTKRPPHKQIKTELINSFRTVCVFVALDILIFDLAENGIFLKYSQLNEYGVVWYVLSIPLAIVLHDTWFYWTHRAMHHKKVYQRFHLTHHRSHNPTPFTAYSFAIGEAVVNYAYVPLMLLFLPLHDSALALVLLVMIFKNALGHCGYEIFPRGTTRHWLLKHSTTVTHHDMHHEKANGNYGLYFTWWDKLMGTEHNHYERRFDEVTQRQNDTTSVEQQAVA